ncbi:QueT transporter family protein [Lacticaseibacillus mingshuiensis]|uniref:QueT transporter family protein n=1 Tax=Lacticaseibacillus mingshuiensis TaxID=2799574 RepID=UPI00194E9982|nr:QueT transporter family protein [Lacticaseibacillus mingshuiensis]
MQRRVLTLVVNAIVAALYVVLSVVPGAFSLASGAIQFRISEMLNHLVVFDRRYLWGVVLGVGLYNAIFSPMHWLDVLFGGAQSLIGLALVAWLAPHLPKLWQKMALNTVIMSLTMVLIAIEIAITGHLNAAAFGMTYLTLIASEVIIMIIGAVVMAAIDRAVHFAKVMGQK